MQKVETDKPTDAQTASACLSYRHDFGLLEKEQRAVVMFQARDWLRAWEKELKTAAAIEAKDAEIARLRGLMIRVNPALNSAFAAGLEEREGGSARRQAKALEKVEALREDVRAALQEQPNG